MRNICRLILALLLAGLCGEAAFAQTATITAASNSITIGGNVVSVGAVVFIPTDSSGHAIAVTKSGGGLSLPVVSQPVSGMAIGYSCSITSGGLSGCNNVPNACTASPNGFAYNISIYDTSTGGPTSGQSVTLSQVYGVCGTWALDHYSAATSVTTTGAFTLTKAAGPPSGTPGTNALYMDITTPSAPVLYSDNGSGAWAMVLGNTSSVTASVIATALSAQSLCSTPNTLYSPHSNTCIPTSSPQMPDITHMLFDYQLLPSESGQSFATDYSISEGSPIGVGNCPFLSAPNAPTWVPITGGLAFGVSGLSGGHYTGCNVPSGGNAARTVMMLLDTVPWNSAFTSTPTFSAPLVSNNGTPQKAQYFLLQSDLSPKAPALSLLGSSNWGSLTHEPTTVRPCVVWELGSSTDSTNDALFINGIPVDSYIYTPGQSYGGTAGNYVLGGTGAGGSYFLGNIYRAAAWATMLTAGQVYNACNQLMQDASNRGVQAPRELNTSSTNELLCSGDSIAYGTGSSNPLTKAPCEQLSGLNDSYNVNVAGIAGGVVFDSAAQSYNYEIPKCSTGAAKNILIAEAGSNDLTNGTSPATVWANTVSYIARVRGAWARNGCSGKIGVQTIISRATIDSGGNNSRAAYNALVRAQALASGADFVNDVAEDLLMGIDGGNSNGTYFTGDNTHPTDAGYLRMANVTSRQINSAYSTATNSNPTDVTASTYTQLDSDIFTRIDATANNVAVTMTSCVGTVFPRHYKRVDASGHTVTITTTASEQIDGGSSVTLGSHQGVTLRPIANPASSAGCHWESTSSSF